MIVKPLLLQSDSPPHTPHPTPPHPLISFTCAERLWWLKFSDVLNGNSKSCKGNIRAVSVVSRELWNVVVLFLHWPLLLKTVLFSVCVVCYLLVQVTKIPTEAPIRGLYPVHDLRGYGPSQQGRYVWWLGLDSSGGNLRHGLLWASGNRVFPYTATIAPGGPLPPCRPHLLMPSKFGKQSHQLGAKYLYTQAYGAFLTQTKTHRLCSSYSLISASVPTTW